jgi:uncharacterized protein YicC (UPF0701 family)
MTDETQGVSPVEDAPVLPVEAADSSPAPQEPEAPVDTTADDAEPALRDEEGKFLSPKAQKRIDTLTWEREQAKREADYYRQLAMQQQQPPEPPKVEEPPKVPTLESVGYDEAKYQQALLGYATEVARQEARKELEAERQRSSEQQRLSSFAERQRAFAKTAPDFEAKVMRDPTLPISGAMRDVIVDSPSGPEIAYYLANNRDVAEQIARLPSHLAALEMGRIEGRLTAQKEAVKRPPPVSKAPPPPPTVEASEVEVEKTYDNMSMTEFMRKREKELSRKR